MADESCSAQLCSRSEVSKRRIWIFPMTLLQRGKRSVHRHGEMVGDSQTRIDQGDDPRRRWPDEPNNIADRNYLRGAGNCPLSSLMICNSLVCVAKELNWSRIFPFTSPSLILSVHVHSRCWRGHTVKLAVLRFALRRSLAANGIAHCNRPTWSDPVQPGREMLRHFRTVELLTGLGV